MTKSGICVCGIAVYLLGCGSGADNNVASATNPVTAAPNLAPAADPANAPARSFEEPSFSIRAESTPTTQGQLATYQVHIEARGAFHLNADYPTSLTLTAPAQVSLRSSSLQKSDATSFAETTAVFPVAFTLEAPGPAEIRAVVDFAVCTEQNCQPESRTLLIPVTAS